MHVITRDSNTYPAFWRYENSNPAICTQAPCIICFCSSHGQKVCMHLSTAARTRPLILHFASMFRGGDVLRGTQGARNVAAGSTFRHPFKSHSNSVWVHAELYLQCKALCVQHAFFSCRTAAPARGCSPSGEKTASTTLSAGYGVVVL